MEIRQGIAEMTFASGWGWLKSPFFLKVSVILTEPKNNIR